MGAHCPDNSQPGVTVETSTRHVMRLLWLLQLDERGKGDLPTAALLLSRR